MFHTCLLVEKMQEALCKCSMSNPPQNLCALVASHYHQPSFQFIDGTFLSPWPSVKFFHDNIFPSHFSQSFFLHDVMVISSRSNMLMIKRSMEVYTASSAEMDLYDIQNWFYLIFIFIFIFILHNHNLFHSMSPKLFWLSLL